MILGLFSTIPIRRNGRAGGSTVRKKGKKTSKKQEVDQSLPKEGLFIAFKETGGFPRKGMPWLKGHKS